MTDKTPDRAAPAPASVPSAPADLRQCALWVVDAYNSKRPDYLLRSIQKLTRALDGTTAQAAPAPQASGEPAGDQRLETLAMMLRRCAHALKNRGRDDLAADVVGLLRRYGLLGSPLRTTAQAAPATQVARCASTAPDHHRPDLGCQDMQCSVLAACKLATHVQAAPASQADGAPAPIDMVLHCPACHMQHIDEPEVPELGRSGLPVDPGAEWTNPPHRSHLCHGCGHVWRPADVATNGVAVVKTRGKNDSPIVAQAAPAPQAQADAWRRLYRLAINEANGLTNYVDDRPELRRAERRLEAIQSEARAIERANGITATPAKG